MLFKRSASVKQRATAALASLQRSVYAMGMLRSRIESQVNLCRQQRSNVERSSELDKLLELVKNGETILHEMSDKIESACYLEEFISIIDSAALSFSEIRSDLEQMMPATEAALKEMHNSISKMSSMPHEAMRQQIEPAILAEVTAAIAESNGSAARAEAKEALKQPK